MEGNEWHQPGTVGSSDEVQICAYHELPFNSRQLPEKVQPWRCKASSRPDRVRCTDWRPEPQEGQHSTAVGEPTPDGAFVHFPHLCLTGD